MAGRDQEPALLRGYDAGEEVATRPAEEQCAPVRRARRFPGATLGAAGWSGLWQILGDPAHKQVSPILYRVDEMMACWSRITAPVLWIEATDSDIWRFFGRLRSSAKKSTAVSPVPRTRSR
jgi:hypothetical protein